MHVRIDTSFDGTFCERSFSRLAAFSSSHGLARIFFQLPAELVRLGSNADRRGRLSLITPVDGSMDGRRGKRDGK
jgi:hypothetical protein